MTTFTAKYASGNCVECEERIRPGEEITHNADGSYTHVECPATELESLAGKPVCTTCWLVGPCDCD
ncbi:hypothetical protein ANMWB30_23990 [Arthrobacter sp. MWB30]|nr:hypothetical protein ANMWB30_23990 [Arthrobacter sp. MWB30]